HLRRPGQRSRDCNADSHSGANAWTPLGNGEGATHPWQVGCQIRRSCRVAGPPDEALALQRAVADRQGICQTLLSLAEVAADASEPLVAWSQHAEALTVARETGQRREVAQCLEGLAMLLTDI